MMLPRRQTFILDQNSVIFGVINNRIKTWTMFVTYAVIYSCCNSLSVVCVASLMPLLAFSTHSRLPLLSMCGVVIKLP